MKDLRVFLRARFFHPTSKLVDFIKGSHHSSPGLASPERCGTRGSCCVLGYTSPCSVCHEWSCNWSQDEQTYLLEGWPNSRSHLQVRRPFDSFLISCSKYLFPGEGPRREGILCAPSATTGIRLHPESFALGRGSY